MVSTEEQILRFPYAHTIIFGIQKCQIAMIRYYLGEDAGRIVQMFSFDKDSPEWSDDLPTKDERILHR